MKNPDDYIFTDPILHIQNLIYSKAAKPVVFSEFQDLFGKDAITHLGFIYPPITSYINNGEIKRIDTIDELSMLKMLQLGRGDFTIINSSVADWLIQEHDLGNQFFINKKPLTNYAFPIMFSKKWKPLVVEINRELALMKKSGELNKILERYGQKIQNSN